MKVNVEFRCKRCGCSTPAVAEIPDNLAPDQHVLLHMRCFHCKAIVKRETTMGQLREEKRVRS